MFRFSGFTERANEALNLGVETASNLGDYDVDSVLNDSALADCTAVKEGHIAQIPSDIEALDSPVPASFLGSYYVASILHPDVVTEDDFKTTEKNFYETFYDFTPESAN